MKDFPSYYVVAAQKAKPAEATPDTPAPADNGQEAQQTPQDNAGEQAADSTSGDAAGASTTDSSSSDAQPEDSANNESGTEASSTETESTEQAGEQKGETASTLATDAQLQTYAVDSASLSAQLNSLLATPSVAVENPTVTFVNDSTGESSTGTLAPGVIATNAAASGSIPAGYAFDYASLYNTNVVSFTVDSKGAIHAVTADGKYASIVANTATDLQIHYKGSVPVTYQYTVDGKSVSAADAGTLVGPSGVTPNGTLNFSFTPAAGLSVESVTANGSTVSGSGSSYSVTNVTNATIVTINLASEHTFTFNESSNTRLTYNGTSYNSINGSTFQYATGNSVTFQLDRYDQWSENAKVLNKLTITLADSEHAITIPSAMGTSATTALSNGTTVTVTKGGSSESPSYTVTIAAPAGQNVYGNIAVSTNYKDQQTSEVWATKLVGADYLEDNSGQELKPGVFVFYSRNTNYNSTYTFSVNSGYTLDASNPANNVTVTATDQNGNALVTSGHWSIKKNYDGSYTITIGSDSRNWQPKDIRISVVATPDATTTYTASYDNGEASGSYTYGGSFVLPENTQTKQGQHFVGWKLEGDTSGTIYKPNDTFNLTDDTIPYATNNNFHFVGVWTDNGEAKIKVNVVVKKADGTSETALTSDETVAGGASASFDQDAIEKALVDKCGSDFLSNYEPLNEDQFNVSDVATDGSAVVTIVYCAKMNLTATGFSGMYDGNAHAVSATASVADATIEYSTDGGNTWSTTAPSATNVSESKTGILVRASKDGYKTTQLNGSVSLTVTPRDVTLASASDSKAYDGTALTNDAITISGSGFVSGQGATYDVTGSQTNAGSSSNSFTYTLNEGTKAENYKITKTEGTLTVTAGDISDEDSFVVSQPADVTYNGKEQKQPVTVSFKSGGAVDASDYDVAYSSDVTDAGTVTVTVTGKGNLTGTVTRTYKINKAKVVLAGTKTVTYDGTEKTYDLNDDAASAAGVVNGEKLSFQNATIKGTEVGEYTLADGWTAKVTKADGSDSTGNYDFEVTGTLKIEAAAAKPEQKPTTPTTTKTETKTEVKKVEAKKASLPKTGDTANTAAPAALGVLGAIAAALGIHRRRREDEE